MCKNVLEDTMRSNRHVFLFRVYRTICDQPVRRLVISQQTEVLQVATPLEIHVTG